MAIFVERVDGWRTARLVTRCAFFVLGIVAAAMTGLIFDLSDVPHPLFVAGLTLVLAAEWLIVARRLASFGIEEALELAGMLIMAFACLDDIGGSKDVLGALLIAVACAAAGLRLLNPVFTTLAAIAFSFAIGMHDASLSASLFCHAVAWAALGLGAIRFERPSYDRMLDWLVIAMPLSGYLWGASGHRYSGIDYLHGHAFAVLITPLAPFVFGVAALVTGIGRRKHAPLRAFAICMACVAFELRHLTGLSLEVRLVMWGSLALAAALASDRFLRASRSGITSKKSSESEGVSSVLELATAAAITPHPAPHAVRGFEPGGGRFGGGGASGGY